MRHAAQAHAAMISGSMGVCMTANECWLADEHRLHTAAQLCQWLCDSWLGSWETQNKYTHPLLNRRLCW